MSTPSPIEYTLLALLFVQTLYLLLHDLVSVPPLNDLRSARTSGSHLARAGTSVGNTFPSALAPALAVLYHGERKPLGVHVYFALYYSALLAMVYRAWYRPYLFGATPDERERWRLEYGQTHTFLPARGDNPRPNTAHVLLHGVFVANVVLSVLVAVGI